MKIKSGIQLSGLKPEMIIAILIVEPILDKYDQPLGITSATDSQHSKTSRHYIGYGLDLRSRNIRDEDIDAVSQEMSDALGSEVYGAFEVNHFHIQFNGSPRA